METEVSDRPARCGHGFVVDLWRPGDDGLSVPYARECSRCDGAPAGTPVRLGGPAPEPEPFWQFDPYQVTPAHLARPPFQRQATDELGRTWRWVQRAELSIDDPWQDAAGKFVAGPTPTLITGFVEGTGSNVRGVIRTSHSIHPGDYFWIQTSGWLVSPSAPYQSIPDPGIEPEEPKKTIFEEAEELVNGDRARDYGPVRENFGRIAALMNAHLGDQLNSPLGVEDVLWFNVYQKAARAKHRRKRDNLVDATGYLRLIERYWDEEEGE